MASAWLQHRFQSGEEFNATGLAEIRRVALESKLSRRNQLEADESGCRRKAQGNLEDSFIQKEMSGGGYFAQELSFLGFIGAHVNWQTLFISKPLRNCEHGATHNVTSR